LKKLIFSQAMKEKVFLLPWKISHHGMENMVKNPMQEGFVRRCFGQISIHNGSKKALEISLAFD